MPLGLSRFNAESAMRLHTPDEANAVLDAVEDWQDVFLRVLGRRMVFAADEYYLMTGRPFPPAEAYEGFGMHEDGIGMARTFEREFHGLVDVPTGPQSGFFAAVDSPPPNPAAYTGFRAAGPTTDGRAAPAPQRTHRSADRRVRGAGHRAARRLARSPRHQGHHRRQPVLRWQHRGHRTDGRARPHRVLAAEPEGHRYLLPDVCLSEGRFLDGTTLDDLPRQVEVVATDGLALRAALEPCT